MYIVHTSHMHAYVYACLLACIEESGNGQNKRCKKFRAKFKQHKHTEEEEEDKYCGHNKNVKYCKLLVWTDYFNEIRKRD